MPLEFFQRQRRVQRVFHPVFCRFVVGDFKNACRHVGKYRKPDIRRRGIVLIIPFRQHGEIVGHKRIFLGYEIFVHKFCVGQKIIRALDCPFFLFPDAPREKRLPQKQVLFRKRPYDGNGKHVKIDNREIRQHDKPEKVFYKLFRHPFDVSRNRKIYEHVEKPRRPDEYRVYEKHRDY